MKGKHMTKHTWAALKDHRASERKKLGEEMLAKGFELAKDADFDGAARHFGYALYQVERLFCLRKGFPLKSPDKDLLDTVASIGMTVIVRE